MGVESSALFVHWVDDPLTRDFDLAEDLIVITAHTGDEYPDSGLLVEQHILPRMRAHNVRYVQVARAGHLEADGIIVLSDTRAPREVHLDGAYKLSQELRAAGTVPQFAGEHRCSLKKYWVRGKKRRCFFVCEVSTFLLPQNRCKAFPSYNKSFLCGLHQIILELFLAAPPALADLPRLPKPRAKAVHRLAVSAPIAGARPGFPRSEQGAVAREIQAAAAASATPSTIVDAHAACGLLLRAAALLPL